MCRVSSRRLLSILPLPRRRLLNYDRLSMTGCVLSPSFFIPGVERYSCKATYDTRTLYLSVSLADNTSTTQIAITNKKDQDRILSYTATTVRFIENLTTGTTSIRVNTISKDNV